MGSSVYPKIIALWFALSFLYTCLHISIATDIINQGQFISDGESIISLGKKFELGFFSPNNSLYRYVGIWYHKLPEKTVVWVANRDHPISGKTGVLTLNLNGNLVVFDAKKDIAWSSNSTKLINATTVLSDDGNLIIKTSVSNISVSVWESFSHPCDTLLPKMKVHMTIGGEEKRMFSSWKDENDPSLGRYLMGIDPRVSPQIVIWDGRKRIWRSGQWNGAVFIGIPYMTSQYSFGFKVTPEGVDIYFLEYTTPIESDLVRFRIRWDRVEEELKWNVIHKRWDIVHLEPHNRCEEYNSCGPFAICSDKKACRCMKGFDPRDSDRWNRGDWGGGCVRKTELICRRNGSNVGIEKNDGFFKINRVKWPDFAELRNARTEGGCKQACLTNCTCNAYVYVQHVGCMVWSGELIDMHEFQKGAGGDLYVRVAISELGTKYKTQNLVIIIAAVVALIVVSVFLACWFKKDIKVTISCSKKNQANYSTDLSSYRLGDIVAATNNFSEDNKIGEGGFGTVYKGTLSGEEIAVKRLSEKSKQGLTEFNNEVTLIDKLQHRNVVRILGYCIRDDGKILVYEYMKNKSLSSFIFDSSKQAELDWQRRFEIIRGIARGLVYLHHDSRYRIIHRDLKASNILLDGEMNPKISDFGSAKIVRENENGESTSCRIGTPGYMAPEYALSGQFSIKSDVYSFGVLLLEIVSGRRNSSFRSPEFSGIIEYARDKWHTGRVMEMADPSISVDGNEILVSRCIHLAMLCVQDSANDRPTMLSTALWLASETITLPMPREPNSGSTRRVGEIEELEDRTYDQRVCSNDITLTELTGR